MRSRSRLARQAPRRRRRPPPGAGVPPGEIVRHGARRRARRVGPQPPAAAAAPRPQPAASARTPAIRRRRQPVRAMLERAVGAEKQVDALLEAAARGKTFTPAQLLAMQATVARYAQTVEVVSRVADRLVGAIKQTMGTRSDRVCTLPFRVMTPP